MRAVGIVVAKEMRETLRDWRTLLMMVVVPILLYPVLMVVMEQLALFGLRRLGAEPARVAVLGDVSADLGEFLRRQRALELSEADLSWIPDSIRSGRLEAVALVRGAGGERVADPLRQEGFGGVAGGEGRHAVPRADVRAAEGVQVRSTWSGGPRPALRREEIATAVRVGRVAAAVDTALATTTVTVLYNAADERSRRAEDELREALRAWADTLLARRLRARGLPEAFAKPLVVSDSSVARPEELGGYTLGRFLPLLLITITILGAFYPAIDLAAGEKERGTLETLLTAPVPAGRIVAGKFITLACVGLVAAALNLGSMLLTFQAGLFRFQAAARMDFSLPATAVLVVFAVLVPVAVLFGSLFLGIAVRAHSFKEAQNALTPVYLLALLPAMLPAMPGIEFTPLLAVIPVGGVALLFRELMAGSAAPLPSALALVTTVLYAAAALAFAARAFGREDVLFGTGEEAGAAPKAGLAAWLRRLRGWGRREAASGSALREGAGKERGAAGAAALAREREEAGRGAAVAGEGGFALAPRVPGPRHVLPFVALLAALYFYAGVALQLRFGEGGLLLAEWTLLFVPAALFVLLGGFEPRRVLSLWRPSARQLGGALLLVLGGAPVAWFLAWLQTFVLPVPFEWLEALERLLSARDPARFVWLLVVVALTPAVCEEVVFRGVLLGGTRGAMSLRSAVLLNAVVFGAFHLSFETAIRFLPTAWVGLLLAWAVVRTGSIWTSVLMHFVNNGLIVLIASVPALSSWLGTGALAPPWYLLPLGALALGAGARLLVEGREGGAVGSGEAP